MLCSLKCCIQMFNCYIRRSYVSCRSYVSYTCYLNKCPSDLKYHQYLAPEDCLTGFCLFEVVLFLLIKFYGCHVFLFPLKFLRINVVKQKKAHIWVTNYHSLMVWKCFYIKDNSLKLLLGKNVSWRHI